MKDIQLENVCVTYGKTEVVKGLDLYKNGSVQMLDTLENIYYRPANIFTAKFIGSSPTNVVAVDFYDQQIIFGHQAFRLHPIWVNHILKSKAEIFSFGIRPEHLKISKYYERNRLKAIVKYVENRGSHYCVYVNLEGYEMIAISEHKEWISGETVFLEPMMEHIHLFDHLTTNSIGYPVELNKRNDVVMELD